MKTISRWIIFDMLKAVAEGAVLFSFIFLLKRLYDLTDLFAAGSATLVTTCQLLFAILPTVMLLTFPMASLLAAMMVYGRIAQDNELTALQAAGYSTRQLLVPALIIGLLMTGLLLWWANRIAPKGLRLFGDIASDIIQDSNTVGLMPGAFNALGNFTLAPSSIESGTMHNIRLFEQKDGRISSIISAPSGTISYAPRENGIILNLEKGNLHKLSKDNKNLGIIFEDFHFSIGIPELLGVLAKPERTVNQQRNANLLKTINTYPKIPESKKKRDLYRWYNRSKIELNRRQALPFACLIMTLLGALLGIYSNRGKRSSCYAMTIFIIFVYYILLSFGKSAAQSGSAPAWICIWIPNVVAMIFGSYIYYRTNRV
jgi:LPS export ABC transporter permease LptF